MQYPELAHTHLAPGETFDACNSHPPTSPPGRPEQAVISIVVPEPGATDSLEAVWMLFCHQVRFFTSREAGEQFFASKAYEVYFLTLEEAFALGRLAFAPLYQQLQLAPGDALRKNLKEAQGMLRVAMRAAGANWERKPSGSADGEARWSARQAAEHVVGAELLIAGLVCETCGYAKPANPFSGGEISLPSPAASVEALDTVIAATTPTIQQISEAALAKSNLMGTVESAITNWTSHTRDHADQIRSASQ